MSNLSRLLNMRTLLLGTLLLPYPAFAQDMYSQPEPPQIPVTDEFGVDLLTANWRFTQPVKLSSDIDPDLNFQVSTANGGFTLWSTTLTAYLTADLETYQSYYDVVIGQNAVQFETTNGSNVWTDVSGGGNTLTLSSGVFTYTNRNGVKYTFDTAPFNVQPPGAYQSCVAGAATNSYHVCAVATSIQFPDGKLITLAYDGLASLITTNNYRTYVRLKSARSSNGISIKLGYSTDDTSNLTGWLDLSSAKLINDAYEYCNYSTGTCGSQYAWPTTTYSDTVTTLPSGDHYRTTTVTDTAGVIHTYTSTGHGNNLVIYKNGPNPATALTYLNDQAPKNRDGPNPPSYVNFTDPDGDVYQYRYNNYSGPTGSFYQIIGKRTSSDGRTISFTGNQTLPRSNVLISRTDENNNTTGYKYDSFFRPIEVDFPEGNATLYAYDARGNVTSSTDRATTGSGLANITQSATYPSSCSSPAACNKPLTITDARNNVTSLSWDQTTGNILTATLPADGSGISPVKRYAYTSMYAWVTNGSGGYVASSSPRSMLTEMRTCKSTATVGNACAGGSADEIITSYYYGPQSGPNNLQVRGVSVTSNGTTLTTCYGYDRLGRKISETKPKANVQVCP